MQKRVQAYADSKGPDQIAQDDVNLHILHMLEGTSSLDAAKFVVAFHFYLIV